MNKGEKKVLMYSILLIIVTWIVYKIFGKGTIEGNTPAPKPAFDWNAEDLETHSTDDEWKAVLKSLYGDKGEHYRGNINKTIDGIDCLDWNDNKRRRGKPGKDSNYLPFLKDEKSRLTHLGEKNGETNSCRNPTNDSNVNLWCLVRPGLGSNNKKTKDDCVSGGIDKGGWPYKWDTGAGQRLKDDAVTAAGGACLRDTQLCVNWDTQNDWKQLKNELIQSLEGLGDCLMIGKKYTTGELGGGSIYKGSLIGKPDRGVSVEATANDCQDRCSQQGECKFFSWEAKGGKCKIFDEKAKDPKTIQDVVYTNLTISGADDCSNVGSGINPNIVDGEKTAMEPLPITNPAAVKALSSYNKLLKNNIKKYMKSKMEHVTNKRSCACDGDPNKDDNFNENCSDCKIGYSLNKNSLTNKFECTLDKCFLKNDTLLEDQMMVPGLGCITNNDIQDNINWKYFRRTGGKYYKGTTNPWNYNIDAINIADNDGNALCKTGSNANLVYTKTNKADIKNCTGKIVGVGGEDKDKKVHLDKLCVKLNVRGFTFKNLEYTTKEGYIYTFEVDIDKNLSVNSKELLNKLPEIKDNDIGKVRFIVSKKRQQLRGTMKFGGNEATLTQHSPQTHALINLFEYASYGVKEDFEGKNDYTHDAVHTIKKITGDKLEIKIKGLKNINFFNIKGCQINDSNPNPEGWRGHANVSSEISAIPGTINAFRQEDDGEPWRDDTVESNKDFGEKKTCKRILFEEKRKTNKSSDYLKDKDSDKTQIKDVTPEEMVLIQPNTEFPLFDNDTPENYITIMFNIEKETTGTKYKLNNNDTKCTNQLALQTSFEVKGNWDFTKTPLADDKKPRRLGYTGIYDFCDNGSCNLTSKFNTAYTVSSGDMCPKLNRYKKGTLNYWGAIPGTNVCNCAIEGDDRDVKYTTQKEYERRDSSGSNSDPFRICYATLGECDAISKGKKVNDKCAVGKYGPSPGLDRHTNKTCTSEPFGICTCKPGFEHETNEDSPEYGLCNKRATGTCINNGAVKNNSFQLDESKLWHTGSIDGIKAWAQIKGGIKNGIVDKKYWLEVTNNNIDLVIKPTNGMLDQEKTFYMWLKDNHFGYYRNPRDHPDIQIVQTYLRDPKDKYRIRLDIANGIEWILDKLNQIRGFRNKETGVDKKDNPYNQKKPLKKKLFLYGSLNKKKNGLNFTGDFIISEVPDRKLKTPNELWDESSPYSQPYKSYKKNGVWVHECSCGKNGVAEGGTKNSALLNPFTNCACPYGTTLIHTRVDTNEVKPAKDEKGNLTFDANGNTIYEASTNKVKMEIPTCAIMEKGCSNYGYGYGENEDSKNSWRGIGRQTRRQIDGGKNQKTMSKLNDSERDLKNMGRTIGHFFDYEKKECNFWNIRENKDARTLIKTSNLNEKKDIVDHKVVGVPFSKEWADTCCTSCKDKGETDSWTTVMYPTRTKQQKAYPHALIDTANHYTINRRGLANSLIDASDSGATAVATDILDRTIGLEPLKISLVKDGWDPITNQRKFMGYGYNSRKVDESEHNDRKLIALSCDSGDPNSIPNQDIKVLDRKCNVEILTEETVLADGSKKDVEYKYIDQTSCTGILENVKGDDDINTNKAICKVPIEKLHRKLHYCQKTDFPPINQNKVKYEHKLSEHGQDPIDRVTSYSEGTPVEKCDRSLIDFNTKWDGQSNEGFDKLGKGTYLYDDCIKAQSTDEKEGKLPNPRDYKSIIQTTCHGDKCIDQKKLGPYKDSGGHGGEKWSARKDISNALQNDRGYTNDPLLGDTHEGKHHYFEPRLRYNKGPLVWRKEGDVWPGLIGEDWEPGPHAKPGTKDEDCRVGIVSNKELLERGCIPSMSSWGLVGISPGQPPGVDTAAQRKKGETGGGNMRIPEKTTGLPIQNWEHGPYAGWVDNHGGNNTPFNCTTNWQQYTSGNWNDGKKGAPWKVDSGAWYRAGQNFGYGATGCEQGGYGGWGSPNTGWRELKGGMSNWQGYKSMANGGLSAWNFWTGMGAHRPLGWPGKGHNKNNDKALSSNFQNWWRKLHQSYFNVLHSKSSGKASEIDKAGIKHARLQGSQDMDDTGCATGDFIPDSDTGDQFDTFAAEPVNQTPGMKDPSDASSEMLWLGHEDVDKGTNVATDDKTHFSGSYGGYGQVRHKQRHPRYTVPTAPPLLSGVGGGEAGFDWGNYGFRTIRGANNSDYGHIMKMNNFNHMCVKSALRTVGPGRDKSCQLYLTKGACRPGREGKGMKSGDGGTGSDKHVSYVQTNCNTGTWCGDRGKGVNNPTKGINCGSDCTPGASSLFSGVRAGPDGGDSTKGGTHTGLGIDCGTPAAAARCMNPSGIDRYTRLDKLKAAWSSVSIGGTSPDSNRDVISIDKSTSVSKQHYKQPNIDKMKPKVKDWDEFKDKWNENEAGPTLQDVVNMPFSLSEESPSPSKLHTRHSTPPGGPSWGVLKLGTKDATTAVDDKASNDMYDVEPTMKTTVLRRGQKSSKWLTKKLGEDALRNRYEGPPATGRSDDQHYNWGGGPLHCGQARLNPGCAWGKCSGDAYNIPHNLKKGSDSPTNYDPNTHEGKGIQGVQPLDAINQSWGACGWSPGYLGLKPLVTSQLKGNKINKALNDDLDLNRTCEGNACDLTVNSIVDQETSGGTVNDVSWIHKNMKFKGRDGGWVFDRSIDKPWRGSGGKSGKIWENDRYDGPRGELRTLDHFSKISGKVGDDHVHGYHDVKDQLLDHTEDRIMNKEGLVINTIDRGLADGNQCTVSGRESAACPRGMGSCRVFGGGSLSKKSEAGNMEPSTGEDSWGDGIKFNNQWKQGTDMNALYDMNDRSRCPSDPQKPLGPVKNRDRHAGKKLINDDRMSGFYWWGIPYEKDGTKCVGTTCTSGGSSGASGLFAFKEAFTNDTIEGFRSSEILKNINGDVKDQEKIKGESKLSFDKLVADTNSSQRIKQIYINSGAKDKKDKKGVFADVVSPNKVRLVEDGGGNNNLHDSNDLLTKRDVMKRPRYSMRDAFVQTQKDEKEYNTDLNFTVASEYDDYGNEIKREPVSCKIGPLTPTRHVCKSMQPFKWIPDPLQDMDNRAQFFEKSRKVHKCINVSMDGTQGENYEQKCAQAGIFTRPSDNDLHLREAYWDKTYTDPRRNYNKKDDFSTEKGHKSKIDSNKINKFDQIFIENSLDPVRNEKTYKKQRNLKAQMVYEDEVRSYYQS